MNQGTLGYLSWFTEVLFLSRYYRILFKHLILLSPRMPSFIIIMTFCPYCLPGLHANTLIAV